MPHLSYLTGAQDFLVPFIMISLTWIEVFISFCSLSIKLIFFISYIFPEKKL
jgi:hypothetical protein